MNKLMFVALVASIACGCTTVNKNDGGSEVRDPWTAQDVIHEKFEVSNDMVEGSDTIQCLFGFITWGSTASHISDVVPFGFGGVAKAKNGAYANACDAANCDQLSASKYTITTDDYFVYQKINAKVKGYPTSVVGVEVITNTVPKKR